MTPRDTFALLVFLWLIGAVVGWCAGWAARGEENRGWHSGVAHQLARTRVELATALDQLQDARAVPWDAARVPSPAPTIVHVHLTSAAPVWVAPHPPLLTPALVVDAMPVLPADEVPS